MLQLWDLAMDKAIEWAKEAKHAAFRDEGNGDDHDPKNGDDIDDDESDEDYGK